MWYKLQTRDFGERTFDLTPCHFSQMVANPKPTGSHSSILSWTTIQHRLHMNPWNQALAEVKVSSSYRFLIGVPDRWRPNSITPVGINKLDCDIAFIPWSSSNGSGIRSSSLNASFSLWSTHGNVGWVFDELGQMDNNRDPLPITDYLACADF